MIFKPKKQLLFVGGRSYALRACLTWIGLMLALTGRADIAQELNRVGTSDGLAKYVFLMKTNAVALRALLAGLDSTNSIQPAPYSSPIPVREICGTIIADRFEGALGSGFYEKDKTYGVRKICAFQDRDGMVWRYHIGIFENRQYQLMKDLLRRRLR